MLQATGTLNMSKPITPCRHLQNHGALAEDDAIRSPRSWRDIGFQTSAIDRRFNRGVFFKSGTWSLVVAHQRLWLSVKYEFLPLN